MGEDTSAHDPMSTVALVARSIADIDARRRRQAEALLCDLLCAAWGAPTAQNQ
jgi:hypothetical protein